MNMPHAELAAVGGAIAATCCAAIAAWNVVFGDLPLALSFAILGVVVGLGALAALPNKQVEQAEENR